MDELARQLNMPPIGMSEEKLNALAAANGRVKAIMEFIEYLNGEGVAIVTTGDRVLTDIEIGEMILAHVGVSKEDAQAAADYIINTLNMLQGKGE